jgi:hypothetical protein
MPWLVDTGGMALLFALASASACAAREIASDEVCMGVVLLGK